jgi:hypothetical protein
MLGEHRVGFIGADQFRINGLKHVAVIQAATSRKFNFGRNRWSARQPNADFPTLGGVRLFR